MGDELGLRERKKRRTREQIIERAMALFDERGFEHVTVADIAAAADIAPRTFFAYFPSKEAVVFHDFDAMFASLEERLGTARETGESAIAAMRDWVAGVVASVDLEDERERCRRRIVIGSPALQAYDRTLIARFEGVLAGAVARDVGTDPAGLRARIVASAATAALAEIEHFFDKDDPPPDPMAVLDEVFVFLRGGIAALQEVPPPVR